MRGNITAFLLLTLGNVISGRVIPSLAKILSYWAICSSEKGGGRGVRVESKVLEHCAYCVR